MKVCVLFLAVFYLSTSGLAFSAEQGGRSVSIQGATISTGAPVRTITVRGEHLLEVEPDFVELSFEVIESNSSANRAKEQVDRRITAVILALNEFQIAESDVAMGGVTVGRMYEYDRNENPRFEGFEVSRGVTIKLRNFADYEPLAAALVDAGVGELEGIKTGVDDENSYMHRALESAARDANIRASAIAAGLGVTLGAPVEVGENQLRPNTGFRQNISSYQNIEEIVVTGSFIRNRELPPVFVPEKIRVDATVWVVFELLTD